MTTFDEKNPNFRVFEVDYETMFPIKVKTYEFDVVKANKTPEVDHKFEFKHEISEKYGVKDLSPDSFYEISQKINDDLDIAKTYLSNKYKVELKKCDEECRKYEACKIENYVQYKALQCRDDVRWKLKDWIYSASKLMTSPWIEFEPKK